MAGELAYDPVTGQLVYSPATGQLALGCIAPVDFCGDDDLAGGIKATFSGINVLTSACFACGGYSINSGDDITDPNATWTLARTAAKLYQYSGAAAGTIYEYTDGSCATLAHTVTIDTIFVEVSTDSGTCYATIAMTGEDEATNPRTILIYQGVTADPSTNSLVVFDCSLFTDVVAGKDGTATLEEA